METDFFELHKAQCLAYLAAAGPLASAAGYVAELQASLALADEALAAGSRQADVAAVAVTILRIGAAYQALDGATRATIDTAMQSTEGGPS